jgi:hypothetical protein
MTTDPERRRLEELLACVASGRATDAECIELDLYLEDRPDLAAALAKRHDELPEGPPELLARQPESPPVVTSERAVGVGLLAGGLLLGPLLPLAAPVAALAGTGVLAWSLVRLRLQELRDEGTRS